MWAGRYAEVPDTRRQIGLEFNWTRFELGCWVLSISWDFNPCRGDGCTQLHSHPSLCHCNVQSRPCTSICINGKQNSHGYSQLHFRNVACKLIKKEPAAISRSRFLSLFCLKFNSIVTFIFLVVYFVLLLKSDPLFSHSSCT